MKKLFFTLKGSRVHFVQLAVQGGLFLFFIALFSQGAFAQSGIKRGAPAYMDPKSVESAEANSLGITLYSFDKWDDAHAKAVITDKAKQIGNAPHDPIAQFKLVYYERILNDMTFDVGTEISMLKSLIVAKQKFAGNPAITEVVVRNTYNELVSLL